MHNSGRVFILNTRHIHLWKNHVLVPIELINLKLNGCRFGQGRKTAYWCQLCTYCAGGTFALYSLLCRHAKLSILPNQQATDEKLSTYATEASADTWQSSALKSLFEKHPRFHKMLLIFVLLGTCMAIGDGVLTPTISGSGIQCNLSFLLRSISTQGTLILIGCWQSNYAKFSYDVHWKGKNFLPMSWNI